MGPRGQLLDRLELFPHLSHERGALDESLSHFHVHEVPWGQLVRCPWGSLGLGWGGEPAWLTGPQVLNWAHTLSIPRTSLGGDPWAVLEMPL